MLRRIIRLSKNGPLTDPAEIWTCVEYFTGIRNKGSVQVIEERETGRINYLAYKWPFRYLLSIWPNDEIFCLIEKYMHSQRIDDLWAYSNLHERDTLTYLTLRTIAYRYSQVEQKPKLNQLNFLFRKDKLSDLLQTQTSPTSEWVFDSSHGRVAVLFSGENGLSQYQIRDSFDSITNVSIPMGSMEIK